MTAQIRELAAYLNQGVIWSSANGDQLIADMDLVYRRRALDWMLRNTEGLLQMYVLEDFMSMDEDPTLADKLRWADIRPYSWIKKTALFEALAVGIDVNLLRKTGGR
jgi:hypothetical protein